MELLISKFNSFIENSLSICSEAEECRETKLTKDEVLILHNINRYCAMLSQTVLQMLLNDIVWECEIIIRSILEGTIKLIYICSDTQILSERLREYTEELFDFSYNKDIYRAASYAENVQVDDVQEHTYLKLGKYRKDFDKTYKERREIEHKWSFLEMLNQIKMRPIPHIDKISALSFGYGLSSHFVHADSVAIGLVIDRMNRDRDEQLLLHDAHKARFMGDLATMSMIRVWILNFIGNVEKKQYKELEAEFNGIMKETLGISSKWDDFYKKHYM